jgi:hypothetical protein
VPTISAARDGRGVTVALRTRGAGGDVREEKSKHLTGVPRDLIAGIGAFVRHERRAKRRATRGAVYERAVREFMDAWRRGGERPPVTAQVRGERAGTVQFWGRREVVEEFEAFCSEIGHDMSPTFIAALARFLEGRETERRRGRGNDE